MITTITHYVLSPWMVYSCIEPSSSLYEKPMDFTEKEDKHQYSYEFSLKDYRKKDLEVRIDDNNLIVEGKTSKNSRRFFKHKGEKNSYHFRKSITVNNDMDLDKIKAKFKRKTLKIDIPKLSENVKIIPVTGI